MKRQRTEYMINPEVQHVTGFQELISTTYYGQKNAICWNRKLKGDFSEIVKKIGQEENITVVEPEDLHNLELSEQGQIAREILLSDLELLKNYGASPVLNIIKQYDSDDQNAFFPTDVYSFHVDRSPVPTDTFLCTYFGESSEILPNVQALQKVLIPQIRDELKKEYSGSEIGFESYLTEHFFDLHYQAKPGAQTLSLGLGNLWKLAVDHPESEVLPCIHRAPKERPGESRLLLIC